MIPEELRNLAIELIDEAVEAEARLQKACEALEISVATYRRWKKGSLVDQRKGAEKYVARKLSTVEEQEILNQCNNDEYKDDNPWKIHASLLDKGIYIASVSTFYRVLRRQGLIHKRGKGRCGHSYSKPPALIASGPNQVWCWDITWVKSDVKGLYYYSYVIIDIWDRSIVKWSIHDREDESLARELFVRATRDNPTPHLFVHSDNGTPMKGTSLLGLFHELGIVNSYSRPRISNDNPFIESFFKTLKYNVGYPKNFKSIKYARIWFSRFIHWYNNEHAHSGTHFITPAQLRNGDYTGIIKRRNTVLQQARQKHPERFGKTLKQYPAEHVVVLNGNASSQVLKKAG